MQADTKTHLLFFLQKYREELLKEWGKSVIISEIDPYKEEIRKNGEKFFDLVIDCFTLSNTDLMKRIHKLAIHIAEERVKADVNMGEFVYNVNLGRTIFFSYLSKVGLDWDILQGAINKINCIFDKFLYYAISHFAEAQNKIIKEKTQFIDSTHQDRLTLLGQMTSSFIHEFRNPLTSINGFIQLLKADHPDMKYLDIISSELDQLNFRISQFLLLSKKDLIGKEKAVFSLNQLIEEVLNFLYPSILDGKVKIIKDLCDDTSLYGYADEIRQVFINIIFNAIDVFGHQPNLNPLVEIKSYHDNKAYIYIDISNNGPMIPEELRKTIFEPFFTTKKLGTGLGLFVCKEIIEKHKGELSCDSNPKKTTFTIKLPVAAQLEELHGR
ncbi:histidine kinase N-terminal domain-containing protein [Bacillus sp. EB600]|uniref:histidine kinase N-terminal domain-containing protein n=1 Tax=Bacillus sp. EB600 TaxID=2806345 RepID=UPI00210DE9CB|nr:histidine kinase N-terminal domain-containing protein [Bacillus sp. EB600]MCQ6280694.1 GHKL domain-containing protein [Bacillus sp. EB600]